MIDKTQLITRILIIMPTVIACNVNVCDGHAGGGRVEKQAEMMKYYCLEKELSGQQVCVDSIVIPLNYYKKHKKIEDFALLSLYYGKCLSLIGAEEESLNVFNTILLDSTSRSNPHCWSQLFYNRAIILENNGLFAEAAADFQESMNWSRKCSFNPQGVFSPDYHRALLGEARCAANVGDRIKAECLLDSCVVSVRISERNNMPIPADITDVIRQTSGQINNMQYDKQGDLAEMVNIVHSIRDAYRMELNYKQKQIDLSRLIMIIGTFLLVVLLLILYAIWHVKSLERNKMISELQMEHDALVRTYASSSSLSENIVSLMKRRVVVINDLLTQKVRQGKEFYSSLERLTGNRTELLESIAMLYAVHKPGFVRSLLDRGLSSAEIGFCYLLLSGMSAKQAGAFICHSNYYSISSTIRSKLGIENNYSTLSKCLREYEADFAI